MPETAGTLGRMNREPELLSVVAPLASLYPAATVLLAWIVLGERLHWFQGLGLAFAALAIALITGG